MTYTATVITVTCTVTGFTSPDAPTTGLSYSIFGASQTIQVTGDYVQSPSCGYTFTNSYSYTIPAGTCTGPVSEGTVVSPSFVVYSIDGSEADTCAVVVSNAITIGGGQGQTGTTSFTPSDVSFEIVLTNPCLTASIGTAVFDPTSITVVHGSTATAAYTVPNDSVDTSTGLTGGTYCGTRSYAIVNNADDSSVAAYATVDTSTTSGSVTLTIDSSNFPSVPTADTTVTLKITTTYSVWTSNAGRTDTIDVTITPTACDCSFLAWTDPTKATLTVAVDSTSSPTILVPTSNTDARSTSLAFDNCYDDEGSCPTTGAFTSILQSDGNALPSFITFISTSEETQTITVAPIASTDIDVWELQATFVPTNGGTITYSAIVITVTCTVTGFAAPDDPSALTYNVFGAANFVDVSTLMYTQTPSCGYDYTSSFTWTGATTFIVVESGNGGRVNV